MVDFHCHILPGIDDGSPDVETSVDMIVSEMRQGVDTFVFTPHFYASQNTPENFLHERALSFEVLKDALNEAALGPVMLLGSEVHYFKGIGSVDIIEELSIGESGIILVEPPFRKLDKIFFDDIEKLCGRMTVVIAHIERYITRFDAEKTIERLQDCGALIQSNAEFFLDRRTAKLAMKLFKSGSIQLLGSDCHNLTSRPPNLGKAAETLIKAIGKPDFYSFCTDAYELLGLEVE